MNSREYILSRARKGVAVCDDQSPTVDPAIHIKSDTTDLIKEFSEKIAQNKANVIMCDKSQIINEINKIIQKEGVSNLIYGKSVQELIDDVQIENKFEFKDEVESFKERIFDYDVSIIKARGGVSSHGICCVASSANQPRLLSLTPRVCITLIDKTTLTKTLSQQLNKIKQEDGGLPTNVIFISGPSRTADIELITVIGVHGSQIFYAIIY